MSSRIKRDDLFCASLKTKTIHLDVSDVWLVLVRKKKNVNVCARPAETEFYVISSVGAFFLLLFCRYLKATGRKNEVRADA